MNEEDIEELKRLFYSDRLTQYGKRKLIGYYEQRNKELEEKYYYEKNRARVELDTVYINARYDERDKWKSKIKEKIEEYKKKIIEARKEDDDCKEIYYEQEIKIMKELLEE